MELREGINKEDEEDFSGVMKAEPLKSVLNVDCITASLETEFLVPPSSFSSWLLLAKNSMENAAFLGLASDNIVRLVILVKNPKVRMCYLSESQSETDSN